ncbi:MAG TPA: cysteine desulfurase family protein [Candidatus Saccharimonadales bacterium]|nr:cysteine desulfurase family protein [Candidatus Saccharimonadales bacterium]
MAKELMYMDFAAATPLAPDVLEAMWPFFSEQFYNPSSSYQAAKQVKAALEDARKRVAHWLGAKPAEVIFTAGATESINLAINGVMQKYPGARVAVSAIEHEAVLAAAKQYPHTIIPVKPDGLLDVATLKQYIDDQTVLVSVGYANNEIGTVQSLKDISQALQEVRRLRQLKNNTLPLFLHTDASQAACYLDLHASRLGVDLLTLNGGKMYGPKQTGVLFVRAGLELTPQVRGGGQEMGLRSGTENVAGSVGLATALDLAQSQRKEAIAKTGALRDELQRRIVEALPSTIVNGNQKKRLPHILNLSWPGIDGERLLMQLDEVGILASTGSACAANKHTASHVLQALGLDEPTIQGSLRLSLGMPTTPEEVENVVRQLRLCLKS